MEYREPGRPGMGWEAPPGVPYVPQQGAAVGDYRPGEVPPPVGAPPPIRWQSPAMGYPYGGYPPPSGVPPYGWQPAPQPALTPCAVGMDPPAYEGPGAHTDQPAAIVASRSLNPWQGMQAARGPKRLYVWLFAAFIFLFVECGLMAMELAVTERPDTAVADRVVGGIALVAPLLIAGGWLAHCVGENRRLARRRPYRMNDPTVYALEFYEDRLVKVMPQARLTVAYADVQRLRESPTQLWLDDGGLAVVIRADDMTAYDAQVVADLLYRHIPPQRRQFTGAFFPQRMQPLDIPRYPQVEPLLEVGSRPVAVKRGFGTLLLRSMPYWLGAVLGAAGLAAQMTRLTDSVLADFGILAAAGAAAIVLLLIVFSHLLPRPEPMLPERTRLVFTQQGLTWLCGDSAPFIPREYCRVTRDAEEVRIDTPAGLIVLPWDRLERRDVVQRFLFGD